MAVLERIATQHAKGKLTARERLDILLDPFTFNELEPFISQPEDEMGSGSEKFLGDGVVTGYGQIDGRTVYVYAQDFTVFGGTLSEMQSKKICRVMDLAMRNGAPIIGLIDSGGARIQEGVKEPWRLCGNISSQCAILWCYSPNKRNAWPMRRWSSLLPSID